LGSTSFFYDYRDIGGIRIPFMWVRTFDNVGPPHVMVVEEATINEDFGDDFFKEDLDIPIQM
jgi:hypothetical protein